jgi:hypothetical protein
MAAGGAHTARGVSELKACRGNAVMRLVYPWVCIQAGIDHDPVDEVIYNGSDAVDTAEPVIKARRILGGHLVFPPAFALGAP